MNKWLYSTLKLVALVWASEASAQTPADLDRSCPIPYTVQQQELLGEAYISLTAKIAAILPDNNTTASLNGFYSQVRRLVSGHAIQGFNAVSDAYACRLKKKFPTSKHAYIDAVLAEVKRATRQAMLPTNFESPESVGMISDFFDARLANPPASLTSIPVEKRLTSKEVLAALGTPNFQLIEGTRKGVEAKVPSIGVGVGACLGTVKASLSTFDGTTLSGLGNYNEIFANMADPEFRSGAYDKILTHAQAVLTPSPSDPLVAAVRAAPDQGRLKTCMLVVGAPPPSPPPPPPAATPASTPAPTPTPTPASSPPRRGGL